MKLEKREITLNEADSIKDIYYLEKTLVNEYRKALDVAQTREEENELETLMRDAERDLSFIRKKMQ